MAVHALEPSPAAVTLRRLRLEDADRIRRWMADPDLVRFTVLVPSPEHVLDDTNSPAATERYIHQLLEDPRRLSFAILDGGVHVGNVGLKDFEPGATEAECFIEIGARGDRGRGVGRAAMHLLLEHCFEALDLQVVRLGVFDFNENAIHLYRRLGFTRTGRYGWHWAAGAYHEVLGMKLERTVYRRLMKLLRARALLPERSRFALP